MYSETIDYVDYNGVARSEKFYFNLTEAEIMELELGTTGGFAEMLQRIVEAKDAPAIMREFKAIIYKSYGKRSDDGRRFIKSAELSDEFMQTEAYSQLFMKLCTDSDAGSKFVNGIMPKSMTDGSRGKLVEMPTA